VIQLYQGAMKERIEEEEAKKKKLEEERIKLINRAQKPNGAQK